MNQMEMLGVAITVATQAHTGQMDKGGKPYILHPLHLMSQLMYDIELAQIAVLHDTIEDSAYSLLDLEALGFSERVLDALDRLTHVSTDSYQAYIVRISFSLDAITVKRKDLEHNSCITRLKGVTAKDTARMKKYHNAFVFLGSARDDLRKTL